MSNSTKFLIIGVDGLIGTSFAEEIQDRYEYTGTSYTLKKEDILFLDITNVDNITKVFEKTQPEYVIHCANLAGGVDFCEKNPDLAKEFHYQGTVNIGKQCLEFGSKFIFISSECVFDGKKESYDENDNVNPLNVYGKWKAESERWLQYNLENYIIVRTMSVFGWDPLTSTPNSIMKVYFSMLKHKNIFVPTFRWGNPTYVKDLAKAILELSLSEDTGLFHVAGASFINRSHWLKMTCEFLNWDTSLLLPQENPPKETVFRPLRINLDTRKFRSRFKTKLHSAQEALELLREDFSKDKNVN